MKNKCLVAAVLLSVSVCVSSSFAQSAYRAPATPNPDPATESIAVKPQELGNAILKILAAAPKDFEAVRGDYVDTGRYKGRYNGLVNMSSTPSKSSISTSANGKYYVLPVLNDVDKSILSPSALMAMAVVKRAMGAGTVENKKESQFGTINYQYRNSNRPEWIELVIHPYGHLTLFIYNK